MQKYLKITNSISTLLGNTEIFSIILLATFLCFKIFKKILKVAILSKLAADFFLNLLFKSTYRYESIVAQLKKTNLTIKTYSECRSGRKKYLSPCSFQKIKMTEKLMKSFQGVIYFERIPS